MWKFFLYWTGAILVLGWVSLVSLRALPDGRLHIYALDVGQGDSMLLQTPDGKHILIDGGPGSAVAEPLRKAMGFFSRKIDLVVITHFDQDHAEGFLSVLREYEIGAVLMTGVEQKSEIQRDSMRVILERDIPVWIGWSERDVILDRGLVMDVIWPRTSLAGKYYKKANEVGMVYRLLVGRPDSQKCVLLGMADTGFSTEDSLMRSDRASLDCDLLKVGHHGSRYSSGLEFLRAVSPTCALISVGAKNRYGHPHPDALGRLGKVTSCVRRTDREGTVEVVI